MCIRVSFAIKLQAWRIATSLNTESGTGAFLWLLRYLNIYFANVCEGLPRKNRIFTRVSLCNILAIYYKRNTQLFYYEGTSLYIPLKILGRVNRLFFRIPLSCCFWKYPSWQKHVQSRQQRNVSRMSFGCIYNLLGKYFWNLWRILIFLNP